MRRATFILAVMLLCIAASPALFNSSTESRWDVTNASGPVASIVMLTDGPSVRVEWKSDPTRPATVLIGTGGKTWVRQSGGDVDLGTWNGKLEKSVGAALLVPHKTTAADKVVEEKGRITRSTFGNSSATFTWDDKGPAKVVVRTADGEYTMSRRAVGVPRIQDASLYKVRPQKEVAGRMASLSGDLFGAEDRQVSATAGARGVGKGSRFRDGGNYDALVAIETRDDSWKAQMQKALEEFQEEGKIGSAQGGSR